MAERADEIKLYTEITNLIDIRDTKAEDRLRYANVNSCLEKCVSTFTSDNLLLTEKNCLQQCFYEKMENYYIKQLK
jgi:hypothetical protein